MAKNWPFILLVFLLGVGSGECAIVSFRKEFLGSERKLLQAEVFPMGMALGNHLPDIAMKCLVSSELGLDVGLQSPEIYSAVGVFAGFRTDYFKEKYGFGMSVNVTALFINISAGYKNLGSNNLYLTIGVGLPYILFKLPK